MHVVLVWLLSLLSKIAWQYKTSATCNSHAALVDLEKYMLRRVVLFNLSWIMIGSCYFLSSRAASWDTLETVRVTSNTYQWSLDHLHRTYMPQISGIADYEFIWRTSHLIFSDQLHQFRWPFICHSSGFPTSGAGWQCSRAKFFLSGWISRARRRLVFEIAQWVSAWVQIDVRPVPALSAGPGSRNKAHIGWRTGIQQLARFTHLWC